MSIADKLTTIYNIKLDIKLAIISKGVFVDDLFETYADKIKLISSGGGSSGYFTEIGYNEGEESYWINSNIEESKAIMNSWDPSNTSLSYEDNVMFFPLIDTSNVTSMSSAFRDCNKMVAIGHLNTELVTSMSFMFYQCYSLKTIPAFNTEQVTNMNSMFGDCNNLEYLPALNTAKVTSMNSMFNNCHNLQKIESLDWTNLNRVPTNFYITNQNSVLRYMLLKNIGTKSIATNYTFGYYYQNWGDENASYQLSAGARQSLVDTLLTYSFDRAAAGYSTCTISLNSSIKNRLTEEEITLITAKGYTITIT